jgi:hypothetical protein
MAAACIPLSRHQQPNATTTTTGKAMNDDNESSEHDIHRRLRYFECVETPSLVTAKQDSNPWLAV